MTVPATRPPRRYKTMYYHRKASRLRREANLAADRCINENKAGTHGPAIYNVRCEACHQVHKRTW